MSAISKKTLNLGSSVSKKIISSRGIAWFLLVSDIIGLILSFQVAFTLRLGKSIHWGYPGFYGLMALTLMALYLADTYHPDVKISGLWSPARVFISNLLVSGIAAMSVYLIGPLQTDPLDGRGILLPGLGLFTLWAVALRTLAARWAKNHARQSQWLFLGASDEMIELATSFTNFYPQTTCIFWAPTTASEQPQPFRFYHEPSDLKSLLQASWSGVILGSRIGTDRQLLSQLMQLRLQGTAIYTFADFCEKFLEKIPPSLLEDDWFAFSSGFELLHHAFYARIKRFFDLTLSGFLILLLLPLMVSVGVAIVLESRGPVFYSQVRTGRQGRPFRVYKFRSMVQNAEAQGSPRWASQKDPRITRVGKLIRLTRIDELPQLWNVLRGDMSLIGPRPERPEFDMDLERIIPYYRTRYLLAPGITGWAQVKYPYGASIQDAYEKLSYDLYYIKNYSLFLDLAITLKTIRVILFGKGR